MWVLTTKGAVSIVKFNHAPEGDPNTMQVRSRRKEWISEFARFMPRKVQLVHSTDKDYSWRFFATPQEVSEAVAKAVLAINYSNFKNATASPGTGLRNAGLRNTLHTAYHKVWSVLLDAGDGDSMYDTKNYAKSYKSGSFDTAEGANTIAICERLGHWFRINNKACSDCGTANPAFPGTPKKTVRPSKAEVSAWWAAHPDKKPAAKAATGTQSGSISLDAWQDSLPGTGTSGPVACPGAGAFPVKDSTVLGDKTTSTTSTSGTCRGCGERVALNGNWRISAHPAKSLLDQVTDQVPAQADSLEAARDAALHYYESVQELLARGEATEDDVDDAIDAYSKAEDAYLSAQAACIK
jgi:ribosomal protein L37E